MGGVAGPMGQCHPLPENEELKDEMRKHARNHARIFNMYNFDYDPAPKSDLVKAWKHFSKKVVSLACKISLSIDCAVTSSCNMIRWNRSRSAAACLGAPVGLLTRQDRIPTSTCMFVMR